MLPLFKKVLLASAISLVVFPVFAVEQTKSKHQKDCSTNKKLVGYVTYKHHKYPVYQYGCAKPHTVPITKKRVPLPPLVLHQVNHHSKPITHTQAIVNKKVTPVVYKDTLLDQLSTKINVYLSGGLLFSRNSNGDTTVPIDASVTNKYVTNKQTTWDPIAGIGISYQIENIDRPVALTLGLAGYYIKLGDIKGTEYPLINDGSYDTLNYKYRAVSKALILEARVFGTQNK